MRRLCLRHHGAFVERVWKDSDGVPMTPGEIHTHIYRFLETAAERRINCLVLAPRGIGKTETGQSFTARRIAKRPTIRYQIISDVVENAQDRLAAIRQYITKDRDFRRLFPEIEIDRSKRGRQTLSKLRLVQNKYAKDPTLEAVGVFGGATGTRADEQFYDDLCNEKNSVLEPAQRIRLKKLFFKTWVPILSPGGWWFYIGTLYHEDDLTHALLANKEVAILKIGLDPETFDHYTAEEWWPGDPIDKEGNKVCRTFKIGLWVEGGWTKQQYQKKFDEMLAIGDSSGFMSAYCNILLDPEMATFQGPWFTISPEMRKACFFKPDASGNLTPKVNADYQFRVLWGDPAFSQDKEACFPAGCVLGWDPKIEKAVVLAAWREKEGLSKRVDRYLDAGEEFQVHEWCVEGQHEGSFGDRIEERAVERGIGMRLKRISRGKIEKDPRIASLGPLIQHQKLLVDPERWPFYRKEAIVFPNGKKDGLDALEGAWSRLKVWLKRRNFVPMKFPVEQQIERGMVSTKTRYTFQPPRTKETQERRGRTQLAERFFG